MRRILVIGALLGAALLGCVGCQSADEVGMLQQQTWQPTRAVLVPEEMPATADDSAVVSPADQPSGTPAQTPTGRPTTPSTTASTTPTAPTSTTPTTGTTTPPPAGPIGPTTTSTTTPPPPASPTTTSITTTTTTTDPPPPTADDPLPPADSPGSPPPTTPSLTAPTLSAAKITYDNGNKLEITATVTDPDGVGYRVCIGNGARQAQSWTSLGTHTFVGTLNGMQNVKRDVWAKFC